MPLTMFIPPSPSTADLTPSTPTSLAPSPDTTPVASHAHALYTEAVFAPRRGTPSYYLERVGGEHALARLYLEAGLLYLEGTASNLLSSSYAGLSSLRTLHGGGALRFSHLGADHTETWAGDQAYARRFFNRARTLHPALDVPLLPASNPTSEPESAGDSSSSPVLGAAGGSRAGLRVPHVPANTNVDENEKQPRRRRRRETRPRDENLAASVTSKSAVEDPMDGQEDNTWYLYLPGLVGAGTALLVVGFLSFSSWRKGQGT